MLGRLLNILIPLAVVAYAAYVLLRMHKRRGQGCSGCAGCPMAGDCDAQTKRKEEGSHE